jgi:hypothetical protein
MYAYTDNSTPTHTHTHTITYNRRGEIMQVVQALGDLQSKAFHFHVVHILWCHVVQNTA